MTLGSHQRTVGKSQSWITPRHIIDALGPFNLDPCAADPTPWFCAKRNYTAEGLDRPWTGRVWLNPPFDRYEVGKWISKLADHGNGIALLHARTEAEWFVPVWEKASAILFLADRLYFYYPDGKRAEANSGAPACLCAFDKKDGSTPINYNALSRSGLAGYLADRWFKKGGSQCAPL